MKRKVKISSEAITNAEAVLCCVCVFVNASATATRTSGVSLLRGVHSSVNTDEEN
jgi:hypothetical protein